MILSFQLWFDSHSHSTSKAFPRTFSTLVARLGLQWATSKRMVTVRFSLFSRLSTLSSIAWSPYYRSSNWSIICYHVNNSQIEASLSYKSAYLLHRFKRQIKGSGQMLAGPNETHARRSTPTVGNLLNFGETKNSGSWIIDDGGDIREHHLLLKYHLSSLDPRSRPEICLPSKPLLLHDLKLFFWVPVSVLLRLCNSDPGGGILADEMGYGKVSSGVLAR